MIAALGMSEEYPYFPQAYLVDVMHCYVGILLEDDLG